MNASTTITKRLRIHGRVQGVYFRESMCQKAAQLGVTGWVRNLRDGTLEATIQGTEEAVRHMLEWAKRGPEMAGVTDMEVTESSGSYAEFERRDTA
ncbi:MAG: acylphosphatase [Pseudomonadota bacterium]|jgi:acylphosphatase|nr:acylphosphatase [Gammaproteobacteria bacterium]MBU1731300.1 acylphosphatase [Gammaproteobacteria bacterium]MBU1892805.1 acylphosphatase [Gammaproteobacteria bacterium]